MEKREPEIRHEQAWIAFYEGNDVRTRETKPEELNKINTLLYWLGQTLLSWQRVEDLRYLIFETLTALTSGISSTIYFHIPSFSGRCDLLNKIIKLKLNTERVKEWDAISKRLKSASEVRNKMAHYELDFIFTNKHLGPDNWQLLPRLKQSTHKGKPYKHLTVREIHAQHESYRDLSHDMFEFRKSIIVASKE